MATALAPVLHCHNVLRKGPISQFRRSKETGGDAVTVAAPQPRPTYGLQRQGIPIEETFKFAKTADISLEDDAIATQRFEALDEVEKACKDKWREIEAKLEPLASKRAPRSSCVGLSDDEIAELRRINRKKSRAKSKAARRTWTPGLPELLGMHVSTLGRRRANLANRSDEERYERRLDQAKGAAREVLSLCRGAKCSRSSFTISALWMPSAPASIGRRRRGV